MANPQSRKPDAPAVDRGIPVPALAAGRNAPEIELHPTANSSPTVFCSANKLKRTPALARVHFFGTAKKSVHYSKRIEVVPFRLTFVRNEPGVSATFENGT